MNKQILLIAAKLLEQASEQYSNHGCNDLDNEVINVVENEDKLCEDFKNWNGEEGYPNNIRQVQDWLLMDYISEKLQEEANNIQNESKQ